MSCGMSHTSDKLPLIWTELPQNAQAHSSPLDNVMQVEKNGSSKCEQDQKTEEGDCTGPPVLPVANNVIGVCRLSRSHQTIISQTEMPWDTLGHIGTQDFTLPHFELL